MSFAYHGHTAIQDKGIRQATPPSIDVSADRLDLSFSAPADQKSLLALVDFPHLASRYAMSLSSAFRVVSG